MRVWERVETGHRIERKRLRHIRLRSSTLVRGRHLGASDRAGGGRRAFRRGYAGLSLR